MRVRIFPHRVHLFRCFLRSLIGVVRIFPHCAYQGRFGLYLHQPPASSASEPSIAAAMLSFVKFWLPMWRAVSLLYPTLKAEPAWSKGLRDCGRAPPGGTGLVGEFPISTAISVLLRLSGFDRSYRLGFGARKVNIGQQAAALYMRRPALSTIGSFLIVSNLCSLLRIPGSSGT